MSLSISSFFLFFFSSPLPAWLNVFQRLATALLCFISNQLQPAVLRVCLHTLRILSRDWRALGPLVTDSALFTLAHLGGVSLQQTCPQQEGEKAEDLQVSYSHIHRGSQAEDAAATPLSVSSALTCCAPVEAAAAATNGSVHHCYKWSGDGGHVVLARGKKDTREEDSKEEEMEEDGDVCSKEAMKVLCNVIYNSPRAQERASTLRWHFKWVDFLIKCHENKGSAIIRLMTVETLVKHQSTKPPCQWVPQRAELHGFILETNKQQQQKKPLIKPVSVRWV